MKDNDLHTPEEFLKKEWNTPEIITLDFKKTASGDGISNVEDGTYHIES